jgi:hypothetical protein
MTDRKTNIFLKIGSLIPGFNGYSDRADRRNSEKIFRDQNSKLLEKSESNVIDHQKKLNATGRIEDSKMWETARKAINTSIPKFKYAPYGESSFFSKEQIKEDELAEIFVFDEEIVERIQIILQAAENDLDDIYSAQLILNHLKEVDNLLLNRSNFISRFK